MNSSAHHSNVTAQKLGYELNSSSGGFSSGKYGHGSGHGQQASPIMPGNGNSQVNYQQRKSLKKTISNEQYKLQNQGGPNSINNNPSGSGIQFHQASSVGGMNTRGNSLNSSQNEPVKITNNNSSQLQYQQAPLTQNFIQRPTSNGNSHGGGVIQQAPNNYMNNGMQPQMH